MKAKIARKEGIVWEVKEFLEVDARKKLPNKEDLENRISNVFNLRDIEIFDTATVTVGEGGMVLETKYENADVLVGYYKECDNFIYQILVSIKHNGREVSEDLKINDRYSLEKVIQILTKALKYEIVLTSLAIK